MKNIINDLFNYRSEKLMVENNSVDIKENLSDRDKVINEFNKLFKDFREKCSNCQDLAHFEPLRTEKIAFDNKIATKSGIDAGKRQRHYAYNQLNQNVATVSQLNVPGKEEFIEKALDLACNIQYGDLRAQALSLLVSILDGQKKVEFIEHALYSSSNIQDENERALVLSSLVCHLRGHDNEELIEHILDFSSHIQYGDAKFQILSSLVPYLYGSTNESIMGKALELVSGIISEYQRIESFSLLLPFMDEQRKEESLEQALELAFNLKDKNLALRAFSVIIPHLDESRQKEISEKAVYFKHDVQSEHESKYLHRAAAAMLRRVETLSSLTLHLDVSYSTS
jgi:hypothetical protein